VGRESGEREAAGGCAELALACLSPKKSLLTLAQGSSSSMMLMPKKKKKTPMAAK
jgi:hypothetical protein